MKSPPLFFPQTHPGNRPSKLKRMKSKTKPHLDPMNAESSFIALLVTTRTTGATPIASSSTLVRSSANQASSHRPIGL
jgi:hypothetical protein